MAAMRLPFARVMLLLTAALGAWGVIAILLGNPLDFGGVQTMRWPTGVMLTALGVGGLLRCRYRRWIGACVLAGALGAAGTLLAMGVSIGTITMAVVAAACYAACGFGRDLRDVAGGAVITVSGAGLVGYLLGIPLLYYQPPGEIAVGIAIPTLIAFLFLGIGLFAEGANYVLEDTIT